MTPTLIWLAVASTFTIYTPEGRPLPRVEAITDRGPILEMIVHCRRGGTGIPAPGPVAPGHATCRHPMALAVQRRRR